MTTGWPLVGVVSQLLDPDDREVVLGDLAEAGENSWRALVAIVGLLVRREAALWKYWRPWLAAFGLAWPGSLLLMGFSVTASQSFQHLLGPRAEAGFPGVLYQLIQLIVCAWTAGIVVGALSRRTLWASGVVCLLPCLFCLSKFNIPALSPLCLFLFVLPAVWGVRRGARSPQMELRFAILLAVTVTLLAFPARNRGGYWIPRLAISWPAWYLVATGRKS